MRLIDADALNEMTFSGGMLGDNCFIYVPFREVMENIDNAPTVGDWISVKDRLPEDDRVVLVTRREGITVYVDTAYFIPESCKWHDPLGEYAIKEPPPVTHWMPMPEPPKEVT